jgi:hypothetical protein
MTSETVHSSSDSGGAVSAPPSFTPGPWRFVIEDHDWHIRDADGHSLQCNLPYYPWVSDNVADWHLIAAAPTMYAALQRIAQEDPGGYFAAIASKALAGVEQ